MGVSTGSGEAADLRAARAESAPRLEEESDTVTRETGEREDQRFYKIVGHRCGCRTCPTCGPVLGKKVRENLLARKDAFGKPYLLTLTVDPKRFYCPEEAYEHIRNGRLIARLMRALRVRLWVCFLEFQNNEGGGWPHWHVMIDLYQLGGWVDLKKAWALWREEWGIGGLDLSMQKGRKKSRGNDITGAILYITKYLTKQPRGGWPEWLLRKKNVRMVEASRAIGALVTKRREAPVGPVELVGPSTVIEDEEIEARVLVPRSLADRMAGCGKSSVVVDLSKDAGSRYLGSVNLSPGKLALLALYDPSLPLRVVTKKYGVEPYRTSCLEVSVVVAAREKVEDVVQRVQLLAWDLSNTLSLNPQPATGSGTV